MWLKARATPHRMLKTDMRINEIFTSIQGEGFFTGVPAVFVRTSGCNLKCSFCDTNHESGEEMSIEAILKEVAKSNIRHIVITGGEPTLQPELPQLVEQLHAKGYFIQIETNGTRPVPTLIDWVTCSPKSLTKIAVKHPNELKVVYQEQDMTPYEELFQAEVWSLQPCDTGNAARNKELLNAAIQFILSHPKWRLSLQTHKMIGVR